MNDRQKGLREWFRRHKWSTHNTPTGEGFYLESPVLNGAGVGHYDMKSMREYAKEAYMSVELDRFSCKTVQIDIYERKHWWKRDMSVPEKSCMGYSHIPSDDFENWPDKPTASMVIPASDIIKLAELIQEAQKDYCKSRKKPYSPGSFSVMKNCLCNWIGVNSSYEAIKSIYSNERLKREKCKESGV